MNEVDDKKNERARERAFSYLRVSPLSTELDRQISVLSLSREFTLSKPLRTTGARYYLFGVQVSIISQLFLSRHSSTDLALSRGASYCTSISLSLISCTSGQYLVYEDRIVSLCQTHQYCTVPGTVFIQ